MNWYPFGSLPHPLASVCRSGNDGARTKQQLLQPHRFLALSSLEYIVVGLRPNLDAGAHSLVGDVLGTRDGGDTWRCLSANSTAAARAGAEPFLWTTSATIAPSNGSAGEAAVPLSALCISGGREPAGGGLSYSAPLDSVACASLTASWAGAAQLVWRESARLPSAAIGHVHSPAATVLQAPLDDEGGRHGGVPTPLLVGGERQDGSEDVWIPTAGGPLAAPRPDSHEALLRAHSEDPGPAAWARLPLLRVEPGARPAQLKRSAVSWLPGPRLLFLVGGVAALGALGGPGAQFAPRPAAEVDTDSGGWLNESPVLDSLSITLPALSAQSLAALVSGGGGGGGVAARVARAELSMLEAPRRSDASFAYSLGFLSVSNEDVAPESLGPAYERCARDPALGCATFLGQVGAQTFLRTVSNISEKGPLWLTRLREHALYNSSAVDPSGSAQRLDEAPGSLLGAQATWALQALDLGDERVLALRAAVNGTVWGRTTDNSSVVPAPAGFGHVLVACAESGRLYRGTLLSCQRNFSCPSGWYAGSCTSGPYSSQCLPCGASPTRCSGGGGLVIGGGGGGDGGGTPGPGGPEDAGGLPSPASRLDCSAAGWPPAIAAASLALLGALLHAALRAALAARAAPARRPAASALSVGLVGACQLALLCSVLAPASSGGGGSCGSGGGGGGSWHVALLGLVLLGPLVTAAAVGVASCVLPGLRLARRLRDALLAPTGSWAGGCCLAALAFSRPWLLVLLLGGPPCERPAEGAALSCAQPPRQQAAAGGGRPWPCAEPGGARQQSGAPGVRSDPQKQQQQQRALTRLRSASASGGRPPLGHHTGLGPALEAVAGAHALLVDAPLAVVLLAAYARFAAAGGVAQGSSLALLLGGAVQLLWVLQAAWAALLASSRRRPLASRGGVPSAVQLRATAAAPHEDNKAFDAMDPAPPPAAAAAAAARAAEAGSVGLEVGAVHSPNPLRHPPPPPPPAHQAHQALVSVSELWRVARTPDGRALASQGLFFRANPALLALAISAVQQDCLPAPWLRLLQRLEQLAAHKGPTTLWLSAAEELLATLQSSSAPR